MEIDQRIVTLNIESVRKFLEEKKKKNSLEGKAKTISVRFSKEDLQYLEIIKSITRDENYADALRWVFRKGCEAVSKEVMEDGTIKPVSGLRK